MTFKVKNFFNVLQSHVQHQSDARRQGLQEPDVGNWRGQFDVAHALTAHALKRNFDAALFAGDALVLDALILAAQALIVLDWSKDAGTEQTVALWLKSPVIDGFWLFDFAIGPRLDLVRAGQSNADIVELWGNGLWAKDVHHVLIHRTQSPVLVKRTKRSVQTTPRKLNQMWIISSVGVGRRHHRQQQLPSLRPARRSDPRNAFP